MNTMQKYVCAYIVECLTGIQGDNPERVYEVMSTTDSDVKEPLLKLVLDMARYDPADEDIKGAVAAIVMGFIVVENERIAEAVAKTIEEYANKLIAEKKPETSDKELTLIYSQLGDKVVYSAFNGLKYLGGLQTPYELKDDVVDRFITRYPKGKVIRA